MLFHLSSKPERDRNRSQGNHEGETDEHRDELRVRGSAIDGEDQVLDACVQGGPYGTHTNSSGDTL
jgi:hypothetical protein